MSAFQIPGGIPKPIAVKITGTSATDIAGSDTARSRVAWFQCAEIAGSTPDLTVEVYDGSTSFFLRKAVAMTANEIVVFANNIVLDKGQYLRVTASAANQVDVVGMAMIDI
jgi:hypothetical protein